MRLNQQLEKQKTHQIFPTGSQHDVHDTIDNRLETRTQSLEEKVGRLEQQTNTAILQIKEEMDILKKENNQPSPTVAVPESIMAQMTEIQAKVKILEGSVVQPTGQQRVQTPDGQGQPIHQNFSDSNTFERDTQEIILPESLN